MFITINKITKYHNDHCILDNASLIIEDVDKIGLVGVNGTGKSTLLKIIAGTENYEGETILKKNGLRISFLQQDTIFDEQKTVLEVMRDYYVDTKEFEMKAMLNRFQITDYNQKIQTMSGGQKKRLALSITLLQEFDLLILDEPTNHLDHTMISYLEKYLMKMKKALLMVTHDRYFLERVVNKIVEVDQTKLYMYAANYSLYLQFKQQRIDSFFKQEQKRKKFLKKELEWVRAGVQARTTKSKDRLQRFEKLSNVDKIQVQKNVSMITKQTRLGNRIMEVNHISKAYDGKILFNDFSYIAKRYDRIGIIGVNGCGKSSLLSILAKQNLPTSGAVELGTTVRLGYYKQENNDLDNTMRVIDYIKETAAVLQTREGELSASVMLERFLFDKQTQYKKIGQCSGGEKRRLYLLKILMQAPNVLLLDEPTNDLDIETLTILESYLDDFAGNIICVSHDRYFLNRVCDAFFIFENNEILHKPTSYELFVQNQPTLKDNTKYDAYQKQKQELKKTQIRLTSKEKKLLESLPTKIATMEKELTLLDEEMGQLIDFEEIQTLSKKRNELQVICDTDNELYLTLLEKEEQIQLDKH